MISMRFLSFPNMSLYFLFNSFPAISVEGRPNSITTRCVSYQPLIKKVFKSSRKSIQQGLPHSAKKGTRKGVLNDLFHLWGPIFGFGHCLSFYFKSFPNSPSIPVMFFSSLLFVSVPCISLISRNFLSFNKLKHYPNPFPNPTATKR